MSRGKKFLRLLGLDDEFKGAVDAVLRTLGDEPTEAAVKSALRKQGVPLPSKNPLAVELKRAARPPAAPKPEKPKPAAKAPGLTAAIRAKGKLYAGNDHLEALQAIPDPEIRRAAALDGNSRGFVNERGRFLDRYRAADYARDFDLISPDAPSWARNSPDLISENLRRPPISEAANLSVAEVLALTKPTLKRDLAVTPKTRGKAVEAPAVIKSRSSASKASAEDVLREAKTPSRGAPSYAEWRARNPDNGRLFDLRNLSAVPDVPQRQLPRYDPARGPSPRIVEALDNPAVAEGINATVRRGLAGGGAEWYNTDPLRQRMFGAMPSIDVDPAYARLMDTVAATSPRARVPDNIRTASYYNYLRAQGLPTPEKPAAGYGSVAQNLHRDNVRKLDETGGWDVFANPKPASFSSNLQGNQQVVTIDTHNFRLPGILARDPRFLETSIAELAKDRSSALETLSRQYPGLPDEVVEGAVKERPGKTSMTYRPQEWVEKGYISLDDAVNDPALWVAKPRDNEYGYYEQWQQQQAKEMGISPAQYQAAMWLGGGDTTGLGSAAEPFLGTMEARTLYTADRLGMEPDAVLDMIVRGEIPALAKGGRVSKFAVKRGACGA